MNAQVINFLPLLEEFSTNQAKWNTNEEVARILYSAQNHPEWISNEVLAFPPSSTQSLFKRLDGVHFKQDGYEWKRRKEGKLIREDHVKLKVQKLETIAGSYVHSAVVPSFHRRTYWLFDRPEIVLVHYLNVTSEEERDGQSLGMRIAQCVKSSGLNLNRQQIEQQIRPILCRSLHPNEVTALLADVFALLSLSRSSPSAITYHPVSHNKIGCAGGCVVEGTQVVHLANGSMQQHGPLERSNSCSSAFKKGLSSFAMRRQPSAFSDTVDDRFVDELVLNNSVDGDACVLANGLTNNPHEFAKSSQHCSKNVVLKPSETTVDQDSGSSACSTTEQCKTLVPRADAAIHASGPSTSQSSPLIDIIDFSPERSSVKGGTKVLIVGGWYLRGHDYTVMFGNKQVPATLFHAGVLRCFAPPRSSGVVKLEVFCDGSLISNSVQFEYFEVGSAECRSPALTELLQRLSFLQTYLVTEGYDCMRELPVVDTEAVVLDILHDMVQYPFNSQIAQRPSQDHVGNSLIHLCASLNFHQTIRFVLQWRSEISANYYIRDLDVMARDAEGRTPLHIAVLHENHNCIQALIAHCPSSVDVLDDRGETPQDLAVKLQSSHVAQTIAQSVEAAKSRPKVLERCAARPEAVDSTALWVMTNGETVTDEHRLQLSGEAVPSATELDSGFPDADSTHHKDSSQCSETHPNVSSGRSSWIGDPLSMDIHIPDSPTTAHMWSALESSDTAASEGARERMANLAQQIIDALPARIKVSNSSMDTGCLDEVAALSEPSSSGLSVHSKNPFLPNTYISSSSEWEELISPLDVNNYAFGSLPNFMENGADEVSHVGVDPLDVLATAPSSATCSSLLPAAKKVNNCAGDTAQPLSLSTTTEELGEFFNAEGAVGPLEMHFRDLRLSDREQRELYEAAKIIQNAYRQYKARLTSQRQNEAERNAAVIIQSYYRRYKQFCYFKKLHKAAVLIQKHFRMHRAPRECAEMNADEQNYGENHLRLQGSQDDKNVSPLMKEHQAALTIQHAYRGHYQRKRQAAARKIQKFMRQSRQKLRKIHASNDDACTAVDPTAKLPSGSSADLSIPSP